MKYCLKISAIASNMGVLNAIKNLIPKQTDGGIISDDYQGVVMGDHDLGGYFLRARIIYNDSGEANRNSSYNALKALDELFNQCESGFLAKYKRDNGTALEELITE